MKNIIRKKMLSLCLIISILGCAIAPTYVAYAQTGSTSKHASCTIRTIETYITVNQCKQMLKDLQGLPDKFDLAAVLTGLIKGSYASVIAGVIIWKCGQNVKSVMAYYQKAIDMNKGIYTKADYHISNVSYSLNHATGQVMYYR